MAFADESLGDRHFAHRSKSFMGMVMGQYTDNAAVVLAIFMHFWLNFSIFLPQLSADEKQQQEILKKVDGIQEIISFKMAPVS